MTPLGPVTRPLPIVVAFAAVVLGWLAAPQDSEELRLVGLRQDVREPLRLPRPKDQTTLAASLAGSAIWGAAAPAAASAPGAADALPDNRWRISAVFGTTARRGLLLVSFADPAKPAQRLYAGDKLPSGHRITSIGEREVCVQIGRKSYRLDVQRHEP